MPNVYSFILSEEDLRQAIDMLRYDEAYQARHVVDKWRVNTIRFTENRWATFGIRPQPVASSVSKKEWEIRAEKAQGFIDGFCLAQRLLGGRLIEG